jgi:hypothetical protein
LAGAAHDEEVAVADDEADGVAGAVVDGAQAEAAGRTEGQDGDHGVLGPTSTDAVAVPGDAVAAVAVVAEAGGDELLAELVSVVRVQGGAGGVERRVREGVGGAEVREQTRDVDRLVVHLATLGPPAHLRLQGEEQRVGALHPAGTDVDPGTVRQLATLHRSTQRADDRLVADVEQRTLEPHPSRIGWFEQMF